MGIMLLALPMQALGKLSCLACTKWLKQRLMFLCFLLRGSFPVVWQPWAGEIYDTLDVSGN